ncbi:Bro-N domain-containing protein [Mammaliicoccus sciuri]|uniref:BRO-N domain-containing protein n=1 Tax=Mammaliicoccus sciuri TaxID=1296 RepID=UPI001E372481|nr:Bro-N domain-containing protein [Mammaliicoccus sciuri]MCD8845840.1 Bro-N domain-containing protein [Mammaliicoccus sciuri]
MKFITENYKGHDIKFINKNGNYWAVGSDVAKILGFRDAYNAVRILPEHVRGALKVSTLGGNQYMTVINEKAIYRLVMRSNKAEALEFQDWICELLIGLRQATGLGSYEAFRMLDKQHQSNVMDLLNNNYGNISEKVYLKANAISNNCVSTIFGYKKMIGKPNMTREMLELRQIILNDTVQLMLTAKKFNLDVSISEVIYSKYIDRKEVAYVY